MILKDPCLDLSEAHPKDVHPMLPKILGLIRMIWVNSEFYKTRERLTGILRKVLEACIKYTLKKCSLEDRSSFKRLTVSCIELLISCCNTSPLTKYSIGRMKGAESLVKYLFPCRY